MAIEYKIRVCHTGLNSSEIGSSQIAESVTQLNDVYGREPTGESMGISLGSMYGCDIVFGPLNPKRAIHNEITDFWKFITSQLQIHKRDLNKTLVDKIDKLQKDRIRSLIWYWTTRTEREFEQHHRSDSDTKETAQTEFDGIPIPMLAGVQREGESQHAAASSSCSEEAANRQGLTVVSQ